MQYWDDMRDKFGFNDGEAIPAGAELYRDVYLRAVNLLLEQEKSQVRAVRYDRPGVHNGCMILLVTATWYNKVYVREVKKDPKGLLPDITIPDEACTTATDGDTYHEVIETLHEYGLDHFLNVNISVSREFPRWLKKANKKLIDETFAASYEK